MKAQTEVLRKLSTDVAQLLSASGSESASAAQKRAEAVRKRAHLAAEMQKLEDELSTLPPAAPSANLAKAPSTSPTLKFGGGFCQILAE